MLINGRIWDLQIHFTELELPIPDESGEVILSGTYLRGAIRTMLERYGEAADSISDLFGFFTLTHRRVSRLQCSHLRLDRDTEQRKLVPLPQVSVSPTVGMDQARDRSRMLSLVARPRTYHGANL